MKYYLFTQSVLITDPFLQNVEPTLIGTYEDFEIAERVEHLERLGQIAWTIPVSEDTYSNGGREFLRKHANTIMMVAGPVIAFCILLFGILLRK